MGDVGWEGGIRVEGDVKGLGVGVGWEVEHGFDCEFRSREEIPAEERAGVSMEWRLSLMELCAPILQMRLHWKTWSL